MADLSFDDLPDAGITFDDLPEAETPDTGLRGFREDEFPRGDAMGFLRAIGGVGDAGLNLAKRAGNTILAGLGGALMLPEGPDAAAQAFEDIQTSGPLSSGPFTREGQMITEAVGLPFQALGNVTRRAGEVTTDVTGSPLAGTAVTTALEAAPMLLGTRFKPMTNRQALARSAQQRGFVVDPVATRPGSGAGVAEGLGGVMKTRREASIRNQDVFDDVARREIGLPAGTEITLERLSSVRSQAADAYRVLQNVGRIDTDTAFRKAVANAKRPFTGPRKDFPGLSKRAAGSFLDDADDILRDSFDAGSAVGAMRLLRDEANKAYIAGNNQLGKGYRNLSNALEDAVERDLVRRGSSPVLDNFRDARQLIAKTHTIQDALQNGRVSGQKLAAQMNKGAPITGDLRLAAQFANEYPAVTRVITDNVAPFSPLDFFSGGLGVSGALALDPAWMTLAAATGSRPLLRSYALSPFGQNAAVRGGLTTSPPGVLSSSELAQTERQDD